MDFLKARREIAHLTQQELANLAGVKLSMVADIESGRQRPSAVTSELLEKALETDPLKVMQCQLL